MYASDTRPVPLTVQTAVWSPSARPVDDGIRRIHGANPTLNSFSANVAQTSEQFLSQNGFTDASLAAAGTDPSTGSAINNGTTGDGTTFSNIDAADLVNTSSTAERGASPVRAQNAAGPGKYPVGALVVGAIVGGVTLLANW